MHSTTTNRLIIPYYQTPDRKSSEFYTIQKRRFIHRRICTPRPWIVLYLYPTKPREENQLDFLYKYKKGDSVTACQRGSRPWITLYLYPTKPGTESQLYFYTIPKKWFIHRMPKGLAIPNHLMLLVYRTKHRKSSTQQDISYYIS